MGPEIRFIFDNLDAINGDEQVVLRNTWNKNAPVNVKTFSTMRQAPAADYSRAIKLGVLKYISANELKFNHSEITALAAKTLENYTDDLVHVRILSTLQQAMGAAFLLEDQARTTEIFRQAESMPQCKVPLKPKLFSLITRQRALEPR